MNPSSDSSVHEAAYLWRSRVIGIAICALGASALIGWIGNIAFLRGAFRDDVVMHANTAFVFAVAGLSLLLYRLPMSSQLAKLGAACGMIVLVVGSLTMCEYLFHRNPGFDEWIAPGRMAFSTALCFALTGISLVALHRAWNRVVDILSVLVVMIALLMVIGGFMGATVRFGDVDSGGMALLSGVSMILLSVGILMTAPSQGIAKSITSDSVGGKMMRLTLPGIVLAPIILGWLLQQGESAGYYDGRFAMSMFMFVIIVVSALRLLVAVQWINRIDAKGRAREVKFSAMIEHSGDVIALSAEDGRIEYVSPSVTSLLGYEPEELVGRHPVSLLHPDDANIGLATLRALHEKTGAVRNVRVRLQHKDGTWRWTDITTTNWLHEPGIRAIVTNIRDVTARKNAEDALVTLNERQEQLIAERMQELITANKELEAFSYSVSHDLRAPLSRIHGFSHVLHENYGSALDEEGNHYVKIIAANTRLMGTLMDSLLLYTRIHKQQLDIVEIDLRALVLRAWNAAAPLGTDRVIEFNVGELGTIRGDAPMLTEAFVQCLSNAVKFTKHASPAVIDVVMERTPGFVQVHIRDNGVGFQREKAGKLFQIFQRLHPEDEFDGNGAGLAFAQRYIERHNGFISGYSEPGKGAEFVVTLPVEGSA